MKTLFLTLTSMFLLSGCVVEVIDSPRRQDDSSIHSSSSNSSAASRTSNSLSSDECRGENFHYTIKRNSRLEKNHYNIGESLAGRIYVGAYEYGQDSCETKQINAWDRYEEDIWGIWIEITQLSPYMPEFIETYFVPEEALSYLHESMEMGMIINLDFITLDHKFDDGAEYVIRVKIENESGVMTSSNTWHNDIAAAKVLGFSFGETLDDNEQDLNTTAEASENDLTEESGLEEGA